MKKNLKILRKFDKSWKSQTIMKKKSMKTMMMRKKIVMLTNNFSWDV